MSKLPGSREDKTTTTVDTWIAAVAAVAYVVVAVAEVIHLLLGH